MNFYLSQSRAKPTMNKSEFHNLRLMRQILAKHGVKDAHRLSYETCLERLIQNVRQQFGMARRVR
ncbi:hypothetical protein J5I95_19430 [Candidatus Poribacteria bacterium]|nr:hypothetical protein [Candidatus Poribacteria bacterium]